MIVEFIKKNLPVEIKEEIRTRFRMGPYPDWRALVAPDRELWETAKKSAASGKKVLIATSVGAHRSGNIIESMLAVALTLRGANVEVMLCDESLPGCAKTEFGQVGNLKQFATSGPQGIKSCVGCYTYSRQMYTDLGLKVNTYSEFVTQDELKKIDDLVDTIAYEDIATFEYEGLPIGEHAISGALRFYCTGDLQSQDYADPILRRYLKSALLTMYAMNNLLDQGGFEQTVFYHGIYIPHGVLGAVARKKGVGVVNWNTAYRSRRFIFTHYDTYHHMLMNEPVSNWKSLELTPQLEEQVMEYLYSREEGSRDWQQFNENANPSLEFAVQEMGIDFSKPTIGLLPNVVWDAQLHYPANAFTNLIEWAIETVRYFAQRPELQLIVRAHPAEVKRYSKSRQPLLAEIGKVFPELPPNIFLVPPESKISTYAIMQACDSVLVYGTKTGVELTARGVPVIVAGEAWIRNKGLTMDASSKEEYFQILDKLPINQRMDAETIHEARKYAYHFFYRRGIFLPIVEKTKNNMAFALGITRVDELLPDKCLGLDLICDGILNGTEFVYPAEERPHEDE